MVNKLKSLVNVSDGLEMTKLAKSHMARFLKTSMPVGGLLAAAALNGPDSTEQRAINDLRIEMNTTFKRTERKLEYSMNAIESQADLFYFNRRIIEPKKVFEKQMEKILGPERKTNESIAEFVHHCSSRGNCLRLGPYYIEKNDELIIKWKSFLRNILLTKVERNANPSLDSEFDKCSKEIFKMLSVMNVENSAAALEKAEKMMTSNVEFKTIRLACDAVISVLNDFHIETDCWYPDPVYIKKSDELNLKWRIFFGNIVLTKVEPIPNPPFSFEYDKCCKEISSILAVMGNKNKAAALEKAEKMLTSNVKFETIRHACDAIISVLNDLHTFKDTCPTTCLMETILKAEHNVIDLVTYGVFCSNLTYAEKPNEYVWFKVSLEVDSERIFNLLLNWIPENLERSWPDFERQIVLDTIEKNMEHQIYLKENYPSINEEIMLNLKSYGPKGYLYLCPIEKCLTVVDVKGANFFVARFNQSELVRTVDAQPWLIETRSLINKTLSAHREDPMTSLDEHFFRETGQHFVQENLYRNLIIFKNSGLWCGTTDYGLYRYRQNGIFASYVHWTKYDFGFLQCTGFRLIFFI
uniref:Uncharacterized protein n=1 Tax=Panagrolaimus sp. JU765 TaxID=591449 RepID=A0AC34RBI0_9BILA